MQPQQPGRSVEEIAERISQRDLDVRDLRSQGVAIEIGGVRDRRILEEGADAFPGAIAELISPRVPRTIGGTAVPQIVLTFEGGAIRGADALVPPDVNARVSNGDPHEHQHREDDAECGPCPGLSPECLHEPVEYTWRFADVPAALRTIEAARTVLIWPTMGATAPA